MNDTAPKLSWQEILRDAVARAENARAPEPRVQDRIYAVIDDAPSGRLTDEEIKNAIEETRGVITIEQFEVEEEP